MKKIGMIGSRRRNMELDFKLTKEIFLFCYKEGDWLVSGGCPQGGDRFAEDIAKQLGCPILIFYPDWKQHGKAAGFVRNTEIAKWSDVLIACVSEDRIGGTEDTVKKFLQRQCKERVYLVPQLKGGDSDGDT